MIYRGFNIRTVDAIELLRYNAAAGEKEACHGVYCEVYDVSDDGFTERLDDFTLAEGYEIGTASDAEIEKAITKYVDEHITSLEYYRADALADRRNHLIGRLVSWIGEEQQGQGLYERDSIVKQLDAKEAVAVIDEDNFRHIRKEAINYLCTYDSPEARALILDTVGDIKVGNDSVIVELRNI